MAPRRPSVGYPKRGDVYLVRFDPPEGAEISKTRRAVIIQNDVGNRFSDLTTAAPITSKYDTELYPTEVLVTAPEGGLKTDSVVLLNQIRAVDKRRLVRRLGALGPSTMSLVNEALAISVSLTAV
ncbi:MAG: type II toxin-antitoxin system PemK/MazF family toxin [Candidatus Binatia bacterium]